MDFRKCYFDVWNVAWCFHRKFSLRENRTDAYWEQLINEAEEVVEAFKGKPEHDFVRDLILAVLSEIERVDKRQRQQQENNGDEKK